MRNTACLILNWNNPSITTRCIDSLCRFDNAYCDIYVVDNGSSDNSIAILKDDIRINCLILNDTNIGFSGGMNLGLKVIMEQNYEYVVLMNNDVILEENLIQDLVEKIKSNENYAAVSPLFYDTNDELTHCGGYLGPISLKLYSTISESKINSIKYSWLTAALLMIRVDALRNTGLLNQKYFMYWEDFDLCMRFKESGYLLGIAENTHAIHEAGTSSSNISSLRYMWHYESAKLWIKDYHPFPKYAWSLYKVKFWLKVILRFNFEVYRVWKKSGK